MLVREDKLAHPRRSDQESYSEGGCESEVRFKKHRVLPAHKIGRDLGRRGPHRQRGSWVT